MVLSIYFLCHLNKGNHAFRERGGFAGPPAPDFWDPGPVQSSPEAFSNTVSPPCVSSRLSWVVDL